MLSDDWKKEVDLPIWYRIALFAHATYFIVATDTYEIYGDAMGIMETQNVNYRMPRDNVTWFGTYSIFVFPSVFLSFYHYNTTAI